MIETEVEERTNVQAAQQPPDEKIFIYFLPRQTSGTDRRPQQPGDWIVAEPRKPVCRGQLVTWYALGDCRSLELELPPIFEDKRENGNTASARVRSDDVPAGLYFYEAYCNGQLALGGSSPGVIIDR